jgi:hypothetical protein
MLHFLSKVCASLADREGKLYIRLPTRIGIWTGQRLIISLSRHDHTDNQKKTYLYSEYLSSHTNKIARCLCKYPSSFAFLQYPPPQTTPRFTTPTYSHSATSLLATQTKDLPRFCKCRPVQLDVPHLKGRLLRPILARISLRAYLHIVENCDEIQIKKPLLNSDVMNWQPQQEPLVQLSRCLKDSLSGHNKTAQKQAEIVSLDLICPKLCLLSNLTLIFLPILATRSSEILSWY